MNPDYSSLLKRLAKDPAMRTLSQIAYVLATAQHETAGTYRPIVERGDTERFLRLYEYNIVKAKNLGNLEVGDGVRFRGRGYVQITGRANYRRMGARLGIDLEVNPELALDAENAYRILIVGMTEGLFTGARLKDYVDEKGKRDFRGARRVVNGSDKAELIAGYAETHLLTLQSMTQPRGVGVA